MYYAVKFGVISELINNLNTTLDLFVTFLRGTSFVRYTQSAYSCSSLY